MPDTFIQFFNNPEHIIKLFSLLVMVLFMVFCLVIVGQIRSMRRIIELPTQSTVQNIGILLLIVSIMIFVFSIVIL